MTRAKLLSIAGGILAASLCLLWGWQQRTYGIEADRWRSETWDVYGRLTSDISFPTSAAYLRAARARERNQLPPDYAGAEALLAEGLRRDPLRPEPWLRLARVLFFQGKVEEAEHALVRAETLDPRRPAMRLEAVQLWTLLQRPEKAIETARQAAEISPAMRPEAARSLLVTGMTRAEAFRTIGGPELPPREALGVINDLNPRGREAFLSLLDMLPEDAYEDAGFRAELFDRVVSYRARELAWRLWQTKRPDAFYLEDHSGQRLLLHDPLLTTSPMGDSLPLGWRRPPSSIRVESYWNSPEQTGSDFGVVTLAVQDSRTIDQTHTRWHFYRMIQPEGVPLRISARVRSDPAIRSSITLRAEARNPRQRWTSSPSDWAVHEWQTVTVEVPAPDSDQLLDLWLGRERRGYQSAGTRVRVMFGGFEVEFPQAEGEPANSGEETP